LALLVVKRGDAEEIGRIFELKEDCMVIGRRSAGQQPDIELIDEVVSRRHLEILHQGDKFMIRDLNSTNGTMLDGDRILPDRLYELRHNSKVGLGVDGDSAHVILLFKETESTNIITKKPGATVAADKAAAVSWLKIDEQKKEVWVDGRKVSLSRKEYDLIVFLSSNAGKICSRDEIIGSVWPESMDTAAISDATIDQLIHRLREKVEPKPARPVRIISKKSFGYMLV